MSGKYNKKIRYNKKFPNIYKDKKKNFSRKVYQKLPNFSEKSNKIISTFPMKNNSRDPNIIKTKSSSNSNSLSSIFDSLFG